MQSEKDRAEVAELQETIQQQAKTIKRFNRGQRSYTHATRKKKHTYTHIYMYVFMQFI